MIRSVFFGFILEFKISIILFKLDSFSTYNFIIILDTSLKQKMEITPAGGVVKEATSMQQSSVEEVRNNFCIFILWSKKIEDYFLRF